MDRHHYQYWEHNFLEIVEVCQHSCPKKSYRSIVCVYAEIYEEAEVEDAEHQASRVDLAVGKRHRQIQEMFSHCV